MADRINDIWGDRTPFASGARGQRRAHRGEETDWDAAMIRIVDQSKEVFAEEANIHWLMLGQVAQAVRDEKLLGELSGLHKQALTQIKWLKTRIKESSPQVLVVPD